MLGYQILAEALAKQKVQHCYGIVGIPVIQLGFSMQTAGIRYYGFRNEQQAAYAAGYCGFLTQKPGVCLAVSGPGFTNAISGVCNAWANNWPMILICGSNDLNQTSRQAFQQIDQCYFVKPYTKYCVRVTRAEDIPYHVQKAFRLSITGRPGPVYLDLPGDVLTDMVNDKLQYPIFTSQGLSVPVESEFKKALELMSSSKKPLVIVGKGAAYSRAENECRQFIEKTKFPFLPTPMGKGVVPDSHPLNISAARSTALKEADLIILFGARLNWILHFGLPPRFNKDIKVIQVDVQAQQMSHNVQTSAKLVGDCKHTIALYNNKLGDFKSNISEWNNILNKKCEKNKELNKQLMASKEVPMTYYNSGGIIKQNLPKNTILIGQGANTMDIGRTIFEHENPRTKLDAGTFGTMGIGTAALIAAKSTNPDSWAVSVMGDSAFGFSAMQCETITRYKLGATIFIINNNGIYSGTQQISQNPQEIGPLSLNPNSRYEKLAKAFGGKGYSVKTPQQLKFVCQVIFRDEKNKDKLFIIDVKITPDSSKKPQENQWLTRKSPAPKL